MSKMILRTSVLDTNEESPFSNFLYEFQFNAPDIDFNKLHYVHMYIVTAVQDHLKLISNQLQLNTHTVGLFVCYLLSVVAIPTIIKYTQK